MRRRLGSDPKRSHRCDEKAVFDFKATSKGSKTGEGLNSLHLVVRFKSVPWWLWLVPVALLLAATAKLPYGYYTFTRIVVCASAAFIAVAGWEASRFWSVPFGLLAILFNPIFPIYLHRGTWFYFDIAAAIAFAAHLVLVRFVAPATR